MSLLDNFPHKCKIQKRIRSMDAIGGNIDTYEVVQTGVLCWEQQASSREVADFQKRGMSIDRKVYFLSDPQVTERHQIIITEREGVAVSSANQVEMDVMTEPRPDASAGLAVVFKVMANSVTGGA